MVRLRPFLACLLFATLHYVAVADPIVVLGSNYWRTAPGTAFGGVPFTGVPIAPGTLGPTDTIVRRTADAVLGGVGSSTVVPIELVALQLVSAAPADFGLGLGLYYLTLQSVRGGPPSTGQMVINYNTANDGTPVSHEGTFDSFFDIFFDVRLGSLDGPIALVNNFSMVGIGSPWDADPAPGLLLVPGLVGDPAANLHLNKVNGQLDFFPLFAGESHPNGAVHNVEPATTPEPAATVTLGGGLLLMLALALRRRQAPRYTGNQSL